MNLNSKTALTARIRRGREARQRFIDSHLAKTVAHQIRATRDKLEWSQEKLAAECRMGQNAISRLESPDYGKPTITTLKRLAAAMDVALIVRFVPFSELVDWVSGTCRIDSGLSSDSLAVPSFEAEEAAGVFAAVDRMQPQPERNSADANGLLGNRKLTQVIPINMGRTAQDTLHLPDQLPERQGSD